MKNFLYILLLTTPILFFSSCDKEEEESCTGDITGDLIVGTWELNSVTYYYPNGDLYDCFNSCNSNISMCSDTDCSITTFNCDGTAFSELSNETYTWSYDPETETAITISSQGTYYWSIITLNSNQFIDSTQILVVDENGNQFVLEAVSVSTRIN